MLDITWRIKLSVTGDTFHNSSLIDLCLFFKYDWILKKISEESKKSTLILIFKCKKKCLTKPDRTTRRKVRLTLCYTYKTGQYFSPVLWISLRPFTKKKYGSEAETLVIWDALKDGWWRCSGGVWYWARQETTWPWYHWRITRAWTSPRERPCDWSTCRKPTPHRFPRKNYILQKIADPNPVQVAETFKAVIQKLTLKNRYWKHQKL